jgi:hypothetical protein
MPNYGKSKINLDIVLGINLKGNEGELPQMTMRFQIVQKAPEP